MANKNRIELPPEAAHQIPECAAVIPLIDTGDDEDCRGLGLERFAAAYCEEDSIYEKLIDGPVTR